MGKKSKKIESEIGSFIKSYTRKSQKNWDPNDRQYDRNLEKKIKAMDPEQLDKIMHAESSNDLTKEEEEEWFKNNPLPGVKFYLNDAVGIKINGVTEAASIISLLSIRPVPKYQIELGSGIDVQAYQNQLEKLCT